MQEQIFKNKILLVLGSNVGSDEIVRYAKAHGAYTIAADYFPVEKSAVKQLADEAVQISTNDIEALGQLIEERHVDGVLAGISEFNLLNAMELAEKYHLPFYCSRMQWDAVERKDLFRSLCRENGVPCPKEYYSGEKIPDEIYDSLEYPVVVKPVDSECSFGVHICDNKQQLRAAQSDAIGHSLCGRIIVEAFAKGQEFTAHYTVANGEVSLSCIDNRYPVLLSEGKVTTIPVARVYPSMFLEEFKHQVDEPIKKLCKSLGLENAILFIQGMYDKSEGFSIFEAGLRSAGEAPYRFLSRVNGVNNMHLLVEHALLGKSISFDSAKENPYLNGKCCAVVSFAARGGTVGEIHGLDEAVQTTKSVIEYENRYPVGREVPYGDTLKQIIIRFVMICDSREQLARDVAHLNESVSVLDDKGYNMAVKIQPERLFDIY